MAKFNVAKKVMDAGLILGSLGVIGFLGLIWLMIYGNMSGNMGFSTGDQGFNDTEKVIENITGGFLAFFAFSNTFFVIAAIVLLIFMLVGLLALVMFIMNAQQGKGFSI